MKHATVAMPVVGVYMMLDQFDRVLYVGASRDIDRRVSEHKSKAWWPLVRAVETYPQADWELALYVERNLIARLNPEFNVQSTDADERFHHVVTGFLLEHAMGVTQ